MKGNEYDLLIHIDVEEVAKANEINLKQGPNYSSESKLRQLLGYARLREALDKNDLSSYLLPEYLTIHEVILNEIYTYLVLLVKTNLNCKTLKIVNSRLNFLMVNTFFVVIVDLPETTCCIPIKLPKRGPKFLAGRQQFCRDKLSYVKVTCRPRFIAEVVFRRCMDPDENICSFTVLEK